MRPASTQKLITGITALNELGDYYQYTTSVSYTGTIDTSYVFCLEDSTHQLHRGSLQGNLYITGVMDPKLDSEDLDILADEIYKMGIDTITGNLYGDATFMKDNKYGQGWCWDDDNPELCSLLFGRKEGLLQNFAKALRKAGIVILGNVFEWSCPESAQWLTSCTHSLPEILEKVMKNSNNTYAETLLYHLGATKGKPSTAKKGIAVEEAVLKKIYADSASQVVTHDRTSVPSHRFADGSGLSLPDLEGAELLFGPEVSTSMSTTVINGKMSSSYSQVITMLYQAVTPGRHTLGSASITADGKRLSTRPVTIEVLPSGSTPAPQSPYSSAPQPAPQPSAPGNAPDYSDPMKQSAGSNVNPNDFFVKVSMSKDVVYEQEAVVCTIKLYTRYNVSAFHCTQQPSFNGFLIEELPVSNNFQLVEMVNGQRYATAELKKCILYPQESGTLTITSGNYDVQLVQYDVYSTPIGSISKPVPIDIKVSSNAASVNIRPLPEPKPANFSGAVGNFSVSTRIKPTAGFKTYAPATYSIIVSGTGNLKYIQNPMVSMPKEASRRAMPRPTRQKSVRGWWSQSWRR